MLAQKHVVDAEQRLADVNVAFARRLEVSWASRRPSNWSKILALGRR
jgi:hypothetical protein